ncbi:MAG: YceD family protein [Solobacterium sp.]|nr:YceD family protein [Solobacterium sp.]MCH4048138.1 YceD family protein [Solobacterium sp.]MCH4075008.1 YceD family protein [Solobacterium sp.]MCI1314234.1 YceD family protein [Solobacterium sp.]MCI1346504.1 YceD family protein [Solobacterium sp.]
MKWTRDELELHEGPVDFDEMIEIADDAFSSSDLIRGVKDIHVYGNGFFDSENELFMCDLHIEGTMICPDAITNEPIEVPLDTESHETYAFAPVEDDDSIRIVTDEVIDLLPAVIDNILLEVPISVTEADEDAYPSGDGWRVLTEDAYEQEKKSEGDPRLAKLKEFKE